MDVRVTEKDAHPLTGLAVFLSSRFHANSCTLTYGSKSRLDSSAHDGDQIPLHFLREMNMTIQFGACKMG
jgi:hypothetical protein